MRLRIVGLLVAAVLCSSCTLLEFSPSRKSYFVMPASDDTKKYPDEQKKLVSLLVQQTRANPLISSRKIIFSEDKITRGYYRYSFWVEPPTHRFFELLVRSIESSNLFETVVKNSSSIVGDVELSTELLSFYHDIEESPGVVKVEVRTGIVNLSTRDVIAQKTFSATAKVDSYDASGAVHAFSTATYSVLGEMLEWLASVDTIS